jgi:hypothetical protein
MNDNSLLNEVERTSPVAFDLPLRASGPNPIAPPMLGLSCSGPPSICCSSTASPCKWVHLSYVGRRVGSIGFPLSRFPALLFGAGAAEHEGGSGLAERPSGPSGTSSASGRSSTGAVIRTSGIGPCGEFMVSNAMTDEKEDAQSAASLRSIP